MEDKLVKMGLMFIGVGCIGVANAYGKYMYNKGLTDADKFYKPILDADSKLIHALVEKLHNAEGSQK
jgi:hypothetical protein